MSPSSEVLPSSDYNPLNLSDNEHDILHRQLETPFSDAGYLAIYRYASNSDKLIMMFSMVMAAAAGACMPMMTIILGSLTGKFSDFTSDGGDIQSFTDDATDLVLYFVYIGIAALVSTALMIMGFTFTGQRISQRVRSTYLDALLRQNIGFFDTTGAGEITARITADMNLVQDGISEKVGLTVTGVGGFIAALAIAFVRSWRLALVLLCNPVAFVMIMVVVGGRMRIAQIGSVKGYGIAASFAEEVISSMRNVAAYGSQSRFLKKFNDSLSNPASLDSRAKSLLALFLGSLIWLQMSAFALAFWQGHRFLVSGDATVSEILTTLYAMSIAGFQLGMVAPYAQAFAAAGAAANRILATIYRTPPINFSGGSIPTELKGEIEFQDVKLVYPSRDNQIVLENFGLKVAAGKTTAVVGPSGSGKSSLVSLIERFYSPLSGQILLDSADIQEINLRWLRTQISLVGQEPFLFNTTIFENIAYGLLGTEHETTDDATRRRLVEDAAKIAYVHDFVSELPQGYDTLVGERGGLLSGGQRQRVAIARAIVCKPQILLLDEFTAALDTKSEKAINLYGERRTVLVIAHRLSTIRDADHIVVMEHGHISEEGTHAGLVARGGTCSSLVRAQDLLGNADRSSGNSSDSDMDDKEMKELKSHKPNEIQDLTETKTEKVMKLSRWKLYRWVWSLNRQERHLLVLGLIGAFISGAGYPLMAVFFGESTMALTDPSLTNGGHDVNFWSGLLWMLAFVMLFSYILQGVPLAIASARLVSRARSVAFEAILRQDLAFFSRPGNSSGALTAFLSVQASQLNGLSGATLGAILNSTFTTISAIAVSVSFGWKLGLVGTATVPLLLGVGYARFSIIKDLEKRHFKSTEAASIASEAVGAIRTVAALGMENTILKQYTAKLNDDFQSGLAKNAFSALLYGMSWSMNMFVMALLFWYGGVKLIGSGEYTVRNFFICFIAIIWGCQAAGGVFSYAPDVAGGQEAAQRLKALLDSVPQIDIDSCEGQVVNHLEGNVGLYDVNFAYPTQHIHPVLQDVSVTAKPGQLIALVGASGSGKSSVLNLIERFYDPQKGNVVVDGRDIRHYKLRDFRKHLALVDQDATLYDGTIRDNVISNDENVSDVAIEDACRQANIWEFVQSLPEGLSTSVGARGSRVSGGQKQRLAIARALLRNPKILLLDEATSALDTASEKAVQKSLDIASEGRTTFAVAHRLSSIAHADRIYVFERGRIIEYGSHKELMVKRGRYWEYVGLQDLGN